MQLFYKLSIKAMKKLHFEKFEKTPKFWRAVRTHFRARHPIFCSKKDRLCLIRWCVKFQQQNPFLKIGSNIVLLAQFSTPKIPKSTNCSIESFCKIENHLHGISYKSTSCLQQQIRSNKAPLLVFKGGGALRASPVRATESDMSWELGLRKSMFHLNSRSEKPYLEFRYCIKNSNT